MCGYHLIDCESRHRALEREGPLVRGCHDLAFHRALHGDTTPVDPALAQRLVDTLLAGLDPAGAPHTKRTGA